MKVLGVVVSIALLLGAISLAHGLPVRLDHIDRMMDSANVTGSYYSCLYDAKNKSYSVVQGKLTSAVAYAYHSNQMNTTGWEYISITTNPEFDDAIQMYGAGYLEGAITWETIYQSWYNQYLMLFNSTLDQDLLDWVSANLEWQTQQIQAKATTSNYWYQISLVMDQLQGMIRGYDDHTKLRNLPIGLTQFMLINMDGDLGDLMPALNITMRLPDDWSDVTIDDMRNWIQRNGHCSALIKVTPDYSDLFSGHTTWTDYYQMNRQMKSYNFPLSGSHGAASIKVLFSGYPGTLSSIDDFYVIDTGMVVIETTNGIMNNELYDLIVPQNVLSWIRVIVANRMSDSGKQWVDTFSQYNSGTYNNQWIVVDHKRFVPMKYFQDGTLFVLEQIPGYIQYEDVTANLETGYWPSFNVPFFEYIFNVSGFWQAFDQYGSLFSYQNNPRARIFRRDANNVNDYTTMQNIMRYNNYMNDPLSDDNAGNAISSRFDLVNNPNPDPFLDQAAFGGIDSKITSASLSMESPTMYAQSGPTHDQQPPFRWDNVLWQDQPHTGQPTVFNFGWVEFGTSPNLNN